jgi:uncharacterized protein
VDSGKVYILIAKRNRSQRTKGGTGFLEEIKTDRNYINAMQRCHASIGYDMYYTTITLVIGFSILTFSNFIPSIVFGLLTGLVMIIALLASLTLLPVLIVLLKPFGSQENVKS